MMDRNSFERDFRRTQRMATFGMVVILLVGVVILAFVGWVVLALLNHFGVADVPLPWA